ncbi:hypothetical protein ANN_24012 [Periplaneta americana]|uniref:G-protein coupled receptors family 1 profile domain-containing protein n=1 Tax=Periplaneta americana TaxID=6978 RepID=A0ABQ8S275_PERAM|nr:hypothetical protein ANN_24012 [Periplaneta americana]
MIATSEFQETWQTQSKKTDDTNILQSDEQHPTRESNEVTAEPTRQCFRTRNETSGMVADSNDIHYEYFISSESCVAQEIDNLKQEGKRCKISKRFANVAVMFVKSHNNTIGRIFIDNMTSYLEEIELLLKTFNKFLDTTKVTSEIITDVLRRCEKNLNRYNNTLTMFQLLYNVTNQYYVIHNNSACAENLKRKYNIFNDVSTLEKLYEQYITNEKSIEKFLQQVKKLVNFRKINDMEKVFNTNFTTKLLDVEFWETFLYKQKNTTLKCQEYLFEEKFRIPLQHYIQPAVNAIIFIVGFVGNVVLAVIIIRHRQMRTTANMMLLNLAVGDMLNLLVNIPVFHTYFTSNSWKLGEAMCKIYRFLRQLGIGVSVYCVVVLSVQKYIILRRFRVRRNNSVFGQRMKRNLEIFLTASIPWFVGLIVATPHTVYSGVYQNNCFGFSKELHVHYSKLITLFDLLVFCIIPLSIIAIFSILSTRILQYSIKTIPGDSMGTQKCVKSRIVSSRVLIAITAVSAISYVPLYSYVFYDAWVSSERNSRANYFLFFLTYALLFGNSCFNHVALCISCKKFRCGFKRYLLCKKDEILDEKHTKSISLTRSSFR